MGNFELFAKKRVELYRKYGVDIIIEGHFHQGKIFENYYNIPSYSCTNKTYAKISKSNILWSKYNG
jgi:UDP-2,3-diacylglucosamine pyrophosphatase LpxH